MSQRPPRSVRHEYQLYVEREVEAYKESVSRTHLLAIADLVQAALEDAPQLGMRDMLLATEVDRIISKRLKVPSFDTWSRRRQRNASEPKRPEYWGLRGDTPLAHAITSVSLKASVVVSGARVQGSALYLAANGCNVTAIEPEKEVVERVMSAAEDAGLGARVRTLTTEFAQWNPEGPLAAVICTPAAFAGLSELERAKVIALLQTATADGGVHLVETIVAGQEAISEEELRARYSDWEVSFHPEPGSSRTFLARKVIM